MTEYPVEQKDIAKEYHQENLRTPSLCNPALGLYLQNRSSLSAIFSQNHMADRKWTVIGWSHWCMRERKLPLVAMKNTLWFPGSIAKARQI